MKSSILICILFCSNCVYGQSPKGIFINPSIGFFRVTTDKAELNNKPFMIDAKVGMLLSKKDAVGLLFSSATQSEQTAHISNIQPSGGGNWQMVGTKRHEGKAFGVFYERFFFAGKRFTFFPSAYAQYYHYTDTETGYIIVGTDSSGIGYKNAVLHNYKGKFGVNFNVQLNISQSFSITAKFAQIDCRVWNTDEQNVLLELPLILGVKYLFK